MEQGQQDNGAGGQEPPAGQTPPQDGGGKTFTQADLDRVVTERLERERKKYLDYEDLKKAAGRLKELETAQLSETEKLKRELDEHKVKLSDAEARASARELEVTERLIRAEVRMMASAMGFANPDDAYALAGLADVKIDDAGNVQGVKGALEKLAKEKPYLTRAAAAGPGSPPNEPKGKKGSTEDEWVAEAQKRFGIKKVTVGG